MSRITGIVIENFMRITGCELELRGGALEIVGGRNKQGKTSFIKALEVALTGKTAEPPEVIHGDESFSRVVIFTDDDMVVERTWKRERGRIKDGLTITGAPGYKPGERVTKSPNTLLKSLWAAAGAVDPAAFLKLTETPAGRREQATTLRKLVPGLDWEELDREKADLTDRRKSVHKQISDLEGLLRDLPAYQDAPEEHRSIKGLTAKLIRQQKHNAHEGMLDKALRVAQGHADALDACEAQLGVLAEAKDTVAEARAPIAGLEQRVAELEQQLAEARKKLSDAEHVRQSAVTAANTAHRDLQAAVAGAGLDQQLAWDEKELTAALEPAQEAASKAVGAAEAGIAGFQPEDDKATLAEIEGAEEHNKKVDGRAKYVATRDKLDGRRQEAARLTARLREIQAEKERQLAEADLPEGLGFDEEGITIGGMPIENASDRERWEMAITVSFLQAAHIGLVIVQDDRFDAEALAELERRAAARGVTVFIERHDRDGPAEGCTIYVEDGVPEVVS